MRIFPPLVFVAALLAACGSPSSFDTSHSADTSSVPPLHPAIDDYAEAVVHLVDAESTVRVDVKVAESNAERRQGLMNVPGLPDGIGMLFVYASERTGGFWMKDTLIPLDIAFFDADDALLVILQMEPCEESPCPNYDPGVAYKSALEVRLGWFEEQGIGPGWRIVVHRPDV
jgi:uncharacterized protein